MARPTICAFTSLVLLALLFSTNAARAQGMPRMGAKKTLAIDQIAGFRAGALNGGDGGVGFSYAGPIGYAHQSYSQTGFSTFGNDFNGDTTYRTDTFWIAPSADYFVIDGLSVGGLVEFSTTSGSQDVQVNPGTTQTSQLPTTTNFTLLPRVGYLFALNDKWGIWPRGGIGYASRQSVDPGNNNTRVTANGAIFDVDVGFIFRPVEMIYFRLGPETAFSLGASHSQVRQNVTYSANANFWQFGILGGIGVFFSL